MKYITLLIGLLVAGCTTIPVKELTAEEKEVEALGDRIDGAACLLPAAAHLDIVTVEGKLSREQRGEKRLWW